MYVLIDGRLGRKILPSITPSGFGEPSPETSQRSMTDTVCGHQQEDFLTTDLKLFIAGDWTEGSGDGHYELRSPGTGEHLANVPLASTYDIDRAVAAARAAT